MTRAVDPFILFAEGRGVLLAPRQLAFCRSMLKHNDCQRAKKDAEYPPDTDADALYDEHRELLNAWRDKQRADYNLVLDVHRKAATAKHIVRVPQEDGTTKLVETDDHRIQNMGAKGLTDVLGFGADDQPADVKQLALVWVDPDDPRFK